MTKKVAVSRGWQRHAIPGEVSQYLKISRSSVMFKRLNYLADLCGCSWQAIAREAIERLLDEELGPHFSSSDVGNSTRFRNIIDK